MMDTEGVLRITYVHFDQNMKKENITLDFGSITGLTITINKATSTIPLVSMGADRAFQLETGNTMQYNISFKRQNPYEIDNLSDDSTKWSNRYWYVMTTNLIDRWQMKTDGCKLTYRPSTTNPYVPPIDSNGYLRMLTRKYTNKYNEVIEGTIQFIVGTMYVCSTHNISLQPNEKTYKKLVLYSSYTGYGTAISDNVKKKYTLDNIVYGLDTDQNSIVAPDVPHNWRRYMEYEDKQFAYWAKVGTPVSSANQFKVGQRVSFNGDILKLTAVWS